MNKYLKFTVIFLAVLIIILFSLTIVVIIKKYNQVEDKHIENLEISLNLSNDQLVQSFNINDNKLYLYVKNKSSSKSFIIIYDLKTRKKIGSIIIKGK